MFSFSELFDASGVRVDVDEGRFTCLEDCLTGFVFFSRNDRFSDMRSMPRTFHGFSAFGRACFDEGVEFFLLDDERAGETSSALSRCG